jgi:poly-gamma-glutamate capsule biosynthesis protein CapA/YwtB (metallophosphatase superfamily)
VTTTILGSGDVVFSRDDWQPFVAGVAPALKRGDVVIGHVETPYTLNPSRTGVNMARASDPERLQGFLAAGFNMATLAGNHIWDAGLPGVADTIGWLDAHAIPRTGAGLDIEDASKPAFRTHDGVKVGLLSYNTTGPRDGWATANKAGAAYVHVITHYDLDHDCPGGSPSVYTFPTYPALAQLKAEIAAARAQCDILVVAFHKGILHTPIVMADYEQPLSHFAIDAGADVIFGHHAHILKGIEVYKGKPIYHGMSQLILPFPKIVLDKHPQSFTARRTKLYQFTPISTTFPFHPEAVHSLIAKIVVKDGKIATAGYIPVQIDADAKPRVVTRAETGQQVFDYVDQISKAVGFNSTFEWIGDEIIMREASPAVAGAARTTAAA